jgi:hypothetical protein
MKFKAALGSNKCFLWRGAIRKIRATPPHANSFEPLSYLKAPLLNYGTPLPRQPKIKKITHITRNTKNKSFAIPAEAAAMPPNPNTAAISAIIRKVIAQPNIVSPPLAMNRINRLPHVYFYFKSVAEVGRSPI